VKELCRGGGGLLCVGVFFFGGDFSCGVGWGSFFFVGTVILCVGSVVSVYVPVLWAANVGLSSFSHSLREVVGVSIIPPCRSQFPFSRYSRSFLYPGVSPSLNYPDSFCNLSPFAQCKTESTSPVILGLMPWKLWEKLSLQLP